MEIRQLQARARGAVLDRRELAADADDVARPRGTAFDPSRRVRAAGVVVDLGSAGPTGLDPLALSQHRIELVGVRDPALGLVSHQIVAVVAG